jgi:hypothetical protein
MRKNTQHTISLMIDMVLFVALFMLASGLIGLSIYLVSILINLF